MKKMNEKIVLVDFAGTLIKSEIIEEANIARSKILKRAFPTIEQHADSENLYKCNREFVEKLTGIKEDDKIRYRKNDLGFMELAGKEVQNQISTNLFQLGMFFVAKKHGKKIIPEGLIEELQRIKLLGYKLAIISGVRTDIISGVLHVAEIPLEFDYLFGQPPILGDNNQEADLEKLKTKGSIEFSLGDKKSDLDRGEIKNCKYVFVTWGHASGGEEKIADYTITHPKELKNIIK